MEGLRLKRPNYNKNLRDKNYTVVMPSDQMCN